MGSRHRGHWRERRGRAAGPLVGAPASRKFRPMTKALFLAAAAVAALSTQVSAQPPAPASGQPQGNLRGNWLQADQTRQQAQERADMMFQRLDANHDGVITRQEADQAAAKLSGTRAIERT